MKYIELIQRLQLNPDEAVIFYVDNGAEGVTWIINRQGVVQHKHNVDGAMVKALGVKTLGGPRRAGWVPSMRWIASMANGSALIFRPTSDFTEATSA